MSRHMPRAPEPEVMADAAEARAYADADFDSVNEAFVERLGELSDAEGLCSARAVDLGCGPGDIPLRVVRARPHWRVAAVDASPSMIALAREKVSACPDRRTPGERIEFVLADAKRTGLPAHSFDVIFSNSLLHHITETGRLWAEARRLARPRALVFIRDLARPQDEDAARRIVDQYAGDESDVLREEYYRSLLSAYTVDEVRAQLAAARLFDLAVALATDRHLDVFGLVGSAPFFLDLPNGAH